MNHRIVELRVSLLVCVTIAAMWLALVLLGALAVIRVT